MDLLPQKETCKARWTANQEKRAGKKVRKHLQQIKDPIQKSHERKNPGKKEARNPRKKTSTTAK